MARLENLELPSNLGIPADQLEAFNARFLLIAERLRSVSIASSGGGLLQATHSERTAQYPAEKQGAGTQFWESDRNTVYLVRTVGKAKVWALEAGLYAAAYASRPSDLALYDAGFLFFATDWRILWRWTGSSWKYLAGTRIDNFSNRPALATDDAGFAFYAADRTILYYWSGSAWAWQSGTMRDVFANRPTPTAGEAGLLFEATDRTIVYRWDGAAWNYESGTMEGTQSQIAGLGLAAGDAGFLFYVTDYDHLLRWDGAAWNWAPGEIGSGYVQARLVGPTGTGWQICDGSTINYLKNDGTTASITVPNLTSNPSYLKYGAVASGINAAVAPTVNNNTTGITIQSSLTGASIPVNTGNDSGLGTVVQSGSGASVATHTHTHAEGSIIDPGHGHGVNDAGHVHTINTDGEPQNIELGAYFRK